MTANTATSWVEKTYFTKGLDPLGVQAPSIHIYGELLPGITNVTDRARYYSFYPWMIWAYEQQSRPKTKADLQEWIRRADCLFTMVAVRHRVASGDGDPSSHEQALVGRDTLGPIVAALKPGDELRLSDYAVQEDNNPNRYFKNPLGGLAQYYLGTLDALDLMTRSGPAVANIDVGGSVLAQQMDSAVDRALFTSTVWSDILTIDILDALRSFCPCQLTGSHKEHAALVDLFFENKEGASADGIQRRMTLGLVLELVRALEDGGSAFDHHAFRCSVYTGALPGGVPWELPLGLSEVRRQWMVYQKHELLSVAAQCLFLVALQCLEPAEGEVATTGGFVGWFAQQKCVKTAASAISDASSFTSALQKRAGNLPAVAEWLNEGHEISLALKALELSVTAQKTDVKAELLTVVARLLLTLAARELYNEDPYAPLSFPEGYLQLHEINLESLRDHTSGVWSKMSIEEWLGWAAGHWGIEAHLRVALRKLRYDTKDTFHVLPTDYGLKVEARPEPTYTTPRFAQAFRILIDIGAVVRKGSSAALTESGEEFRRKCFV